MPFAAPVTNATFPAKLPFSVAISSSFSLAKGGLFVAA
jgi:hypothetical protein